MSRHLARVSEEMSHVEVRGTVRHAERGPFAKRIKELHALLKAQPDFHENHRRSRTLDGAVQEHHRRSRTLGGAQPRTSPAQPDVKRAWPKDVSQSVCQSRKLNLCNRQPALYGNSLNCVVATTHLGDTCLIWQLAELRGGHHAF